MQRKDVERVWPERLKIRDTGLHDDLGGPGQRIYTTAGRGYERVEYVRADLYDALLAERDAALAAAPQPAPAPAADEREAMIRAMHMTADSCPLDRSLFDTIADALLADGYRKADPLADERVRGFSPTHQHKKRGTAYELIGAACIQSDEPLEDMAVVEVYVGSDGDLWARRQSEFHDGRFEAIREAGA